MADIVRMIKKFTCYKLIFENLKKDGIIKLWEPKREFYTYKIL